MGEVLQAEFERQAEAYPPCTCIKCRKKLAYPPAADWHTVEVFRAFTCFSLTFACSLSCQFVSVTRCTRWPEIRELCSCSAGICDFTFIIRFTCKLVGPVSLQSQTELHSIAFHITKWQQKSVIISFKSNYRNSESVWNWYPTRRICIIAFICYPACLLHH